MARWYVPEAARSYLPLTIGVLEWVDIVEEMTGRVTTSVEADAVSPAREEAATPSPEGRRTSSPTRAPTRMPPLGPTPTPTPTATPTITAVASTQNELEFRPDWLVQLQGQLESWWGTATGVSTTTLDGAGWSIPMPRILRIKTQRKALCTTQWGLPVVPRSPVY